MKILLAFLLCLPAGFYQLQVTTAGGGTLLMNSLQGKKILLVNIATGSKNVDQLGELQQLKQQYGDSVEIIAFPSNSFGHETRTNQEIVQFCQSGYGVTYTIAAKDAVSGASRQAVFQWLSNATENGAGNIEPKGDFQKFLVSGEGKLIGIFASAVSPLDSSVINAITGH
jgi:glutathione peroxidase